MSSSSKEATTTTTVDAATTTTTTAVEGLTTAVSDQLQITTTTTTATANADTAANKYNRWTLLDDSTVDYGYLGRTNGAGIENDAKYSTGFYITTAINYTNGPAHMGHAYEGITTDVIARFHRLLNVQPVYFCTGADEHGQKIANTAAEQGRAPQDICDYYVTGFQVLNQRTAVSYDDYIRTTSTRHKRTVHEIWNRCAAAGDVYLDTYEGWYNVREEAFVTDSEAALHNFQDPATGLPLKKVAEASYFFRMSRYRDRLIQHIEDHPEFIQPAQHRHFILQRLKSDELRDLSISRTTFSWGIPVPEGFEANHVLYVWMDALTNYITGVNGLQVIPDVTPVGLHKFWPAAVHIIGKDILWFHTVIWPTLLFSANVPLPLTVFAHGFVNDKEGKKMSKSLGNVVDPHDMLDKYCSDTFRWYLCKEAPYGGELSFGEDNLRDMHNADLCDTMGNLVHRATNLCAKYCNGVVPDVPVANPMPIDVSNILEQYTHKMQHFELQGAAFVACQGFAAVNGYLQEAAPWKLKGDDDATNTQRQVIVRTVLESLYVLAHLLLPFVPAGASRLFQEKLHTPPVTALMDLLSQPTHLKVGTIIEVGTVLYTKALSEAELQDAANAANKSTTKESFADAQKRKKEQKAKLLAANQQKQQQKGTAGEEDGQQHEVEFTKMDIRVGEITQVWLHEKADKLYCEHIAVGEAEPRPIASGLRDHYTPDQLLHRKVLVVCNLKATKLLDFMSHGMVLAAKSSDGATVELVDPPANAVVGERVSLEGLSLPLPEPWSSTQIKKKKVWESIAKELQTGAGGIATWQGRTLMTTAGPCKVASLEQAPIS